MRYLCLGLVLVTCACASPPSPRPTFADANDEILYYQRLNALQPLAPPNVARPVPYTIWENGTYRMVWAAPMVLNP